MQYPPQQPPSQFPSQPQWPPQQQWQQPPNQYPYYPPPPYQPPPGRLSRFFRWFWHSHPLIKIPILLFVGAAAISGAWQGITESITPPAPTSTVITSQAAQPTAQPTLAPTPTPTATPKPVPTESPAQLEQAFKASATSTTVAALDKDGNADQGHIVHFTCTIFGFVKDASGNTAGANVDDPNTSGVIQVAFPSGTDLSQLNTGDTLEVWGIDGGTSTGQNAFGATIQEVGVAAQYMTDQTTGYSTP